MKNEVLHRVQQERKILSAIKKDGRLTGLVTSCVGKHVIEGKIEGRIKVTGGRGRRRKKLLDNLKGNRGYWKLKEEALHRILWITSFGRGYVPLVRQTTE
jgi:hypothetical protein